MIVFSQKKTREKSPEMHKLKGHIFDFHSHILPKMDDGSRSMEESMQMLHTSLRQGVCCIVLTPHFYASRDYPEHFLEKRERILRLVRNELSYSVPLLIAGAEVQYFEGITVMDELPRMRIEKSPGLLLEMPFCTWSDRVVEDILELNNREEYQIILAHIERYVRYQKESTIQKLVDNGVLMQSNAGFFLERHTSGKALRMLEKGWIHLLGSDSHNMTSRPPNLGLACELICQKRGSEAVKQIMECGMNLLLTDTEINRPIYSGKAGGTK